MVEVVKAHGLKYWQEAICRQTEACLEESVSILWLKCIFGKSFVGRYMRRFDDDRRNVE